MRAVNLLPPDTRGASKSSAELAVGPEAKGGAGAFVVLGVLAACVAGVAGVVLTDNTIKQRNADLDRVAQQQQQLQAQVTKLKPYADFDAAAKARVQTVRDLAGSRFDWEQTLRDLSRAIPQDVSLRQLSGDIATDAGGQGGSLRSAISAPAITHHRLRAGPDAGRSPDGAPARHRRRDARLALQVHGRGDRVLRHDGTATERRNAQPCGTGKRPAFDVIMFFEGEAAKVGVTPVTATGTVAETPTPTPTPTPEAGGTTDSSSGTTTTTTATTDGATK